jgi:hypothetical protein
MGWPNVVEEEEEEANKLMESATRQTLKIGGQKIGWQLGEGGKGHRDRNAALKASHVGQTSIGPMTSSRHESERSRPWTTK